MLCGLSNDTTPQTNTVNGQVQEQWLTLIEVMWYDMVQYGTKTVTVTWHTVVLTTQPYYCRSQKQGYEPINEHNICSLKQ